MQNNPKIDFLKEINSDIYAKSLNNFSAYFNSIWDILEPDKPLLWNWHHRLICEYLEACYLGQFKRLIINMPPRYTKSNLITVAFPTWIWKRDPRKRFICASYSQSLSTKHSVDRRGIIESQWYRDMPGKKFKISTDQNMKTEFQNDQRGVMIASSIKGTLTGKGCDILIVDDPQSPKLAQSEIERNNVNLAFDRTISTRLDDKENGVMIIVMQRLHENDLTGHLIAKGGWEVLKIPGIETKGSTYLFPLSHKIKERKPNQILHEAREDLPKLMAQKQALGSYGFAGQYQQEPSPDGGGIIKREWFKFYKIIPDKFDVQVMSIDTAVKGEENSDYFVAQVWGKIAAQKYLLDQVRIRADFTQTILVIKSLAAKWPKAIAKIVEDKANGPAIISSLQKQITGLIAYNPKTDKVSRMRAVSPEFEAGNIYIPDPSIAPWVHDYIEEFCLFPRGANDDQCDSTSQLLLRFQEKASGNFNDNMMKSSKSMVHDIASGGDNW